MRDVPLQRLLELCAGHRDDGGVVVERADLENLAISERSSRQVRANPSCVHEADVGLPILAEDVGDEIAEGRLVVEIALDGGGRRDAGRLVALRGRLVEVRLYERGNVRVWRDRLSFEDARDERRSLRC